ncbi:MAG: hypothetical protein QN131_14520 [Armatimonadota bacterium]|nr:hypothetical protein [Armatimonadota bacterium]MDR7551126.1 hypothetical protein [Armatimonadota bacterium]
MTTWNLVLPDVAVPGHPGRADLTVADGRIKGVGPRPAWQGHVEWDGGGRWVLPALVGPPAGPSIREGHLWTTP